LTAPASGFATAYLAASIADFSQKRGNLLAYDSRFVWKRHVHTAWGKGRLFFARARRHGPIAPTYTFIATIPAQVFVVFFEPGPGPRERVAAAGTPSP